MGNRSPCAGDNDVKKFGKDVSTNSLVSADEFELVSKSIGIAVVEVNVALHSRTTYKSVEETITR